jgi:hypothetical protein
LEEHTRTEGPIKYTFREEQKESRCAFDSVPHAGLGEISRSVIVIVPVTEVYVNRSRLKGGACIMHVVSSK